jgi:hypothetical protein
MHAMEGPEWKTFKGGARLSVSQIRFLDGEDATRAMTERKTLSFDLRDSHCSLNKETDNGLVHVPGSEWKGSVKPTEGGVSQECQGLRQ